MRNNTGYESIYKVWEEYQEYSEKTWQPAGHEKNWKPKNEDHYFAISENGRIREYIFNDDRLDAWNIITGNYFKECEDAENYKHFLEIDRQVRDIADELGRPTEEDWKNNNIQKYFLCYEPTDNNIKLGWNRLSKIAGVIFCLKCDEFLDTCLDRIGQADLEFWAKYERR